MSDKKPEAPGAEKRRYIRINGNFPVEFTMVRLQDDLLDLPWSKGHTSNVSKGGICLETDILSEPVIKYLNKRNLFLELRIHVPTMASPMKVVAEVMWYKPIEGTEKCFIIGMDFRSVVEDDLKKLISQAWCIRTVSKTLSILALIGFMGALGTAVMDQSVSSQENSGSRKSIENVKIQSTP